MNIWREERKIKRPLLDLCGGLVLGEASALLIFTAKRSGLQAVCIACLVLTALILCGLLAEGRGFAGTSGLRENRGGGGARGLRGKRGGVETRGLRENRGGGGARGLRGNRGGKIARGFILLSIAGAFTGAGCVWFSAAAYSRMNLQLQEEIQCREARSSSVEGEICGISGEEGKWQATLKNPVLRKDAGNTAAFPKKLLCYLEGGPDLKIGMRVLVRGKLKPLSPPGNPGGFDFRLYCMAKGVGGTCSAKSVEILDGRYLPAPEAVRRLRGRLVSILDRIAEPDDAGILKAALLGDKSGMDEELYDLYRRNGIAHLLAISGLHVSLIGMSLWKLLRKAGCGFGASGAAAGGFLILYGSLAGFSPSVVRAVVMLLFSFAAESLGRTYDLISAMCVSALLILIPEPFMLTQASLQLSFGAVGAIAFVGQPLIRAFGAKGMLEALLVSLSVQIVTAPVILYHSFEIPMYGIFLNLAVIPLMAFVVCSGFAGILASLIWEPLGVAAVGGGHFILAFYAALCRAAERLPAAVLNLGRPTLRQAACYAAIMSAGIFLLCRGRRQIRGSRFGGGKDICVFSCGLLFCALSCLFLLPVPAAGCSVTFLDVGQGDGIFIRAGGRSMLVDCGSSQDRQVGKNRLVPFLKSKGVTRLDAVVVTHADADHTSGITYLFEEPRGIFAERLVMPLAGRGEEPYEKLEKLAVAGGTRVVYGCRGSEPFGGGRGGDGEKPCSLRILSPPGDLPHGGRNDESLVLLLEYGNFRLLLTGDVEKAGEEGMARDGLLAPVTVLKAAHHGSSSSSTETFLGAVSPALTVISYGEGNRYGHPADEVMERLLAHGSRIYTTAEYGAVEIWTDGKRMRVHGYRK